MYPDVQNEPLPSEYQTKQRTITTKLYVDDCLYTLDNSNIIPQIILDALDYEGICTCVEGLMSCLLNKNNAENREYLKKVITYHVAHEFDNLFAWSDESNSYYEKG